MRNRWIAAPAAALLLLAGCQASKKKRIAVVPKGTSHIFWLTVRAGAEAAGQKFGVEILWNGPPQETEYDRQMQIVDSMLAQHVDGLAVAAAERKALNRSLDRAAELGIPVTVFDSGVDSTNYMTFLATNNYEGGKMGARELARLVGGAGKVAMVMHAPGSASTMDRERGFEDVMKAEFPKIEIVARQFSMSNPSKGMAAAENILSAHPDLNGIFASSEPSSMGVALALKSRGLSGKVKCVTFDSSDKLIEDLKGGTIDAMVVQDPFKMGFEAVKTLVDKLHGVASPKQIDLPARLVKKEDLDKPDVHELLYPDVKKYMAQ
ncbi:MAG TPA: substrate-binding domain-containing protein [Bryobacteraceae bacterium]|nr:substrate-binding domain-containing protein [Bryobacteraceae bacterium]